ncbi:putative membrane protein [Nonlabens dokdonensis]|uniref:Membrane protein n=2 Tax=Nonlabens dokdonensis TaxID=328515 RepID=A0ABX5PUS3_9FLAO|nr:MauE/DoxX family redox-associated membrane protein [Nonlabens dokdonensis]AGC78311.1 putative lipoprotein involved in motility and chitin utilization [Nonlabens dokdonensis DSW-6]PZX37801.1 putative membrane protein [Nonlabens dokdonensis]
MATTLKRKLLLYSFVAFYAFAGIMHFITPEVYLKVIPDWLGNKTLLNYAAGAVEIAVALLALFPATRKFAGYLAIAMLAAFIISHVYFIQLGSCAGDLCIPEWIGYFRLIVIHPLLMYWAWKISKL